MKPKQLALQWPKSCQTHMVETGAFVAVEAVVIIVEQELRNQIQIGC